MIWSLFHRRLVAAWLIAAVPLAHGIGAWHGVAHAHQPHAIGPSQHGLGHPPGLDPRHANEAPALHDCKAFEAAAAAPTPPGFVATLATIADAPAPAGISLPLPFPHRAWAHAPARAPPTGR